MNILEKIRRKIVRIILVEKNRLLSKGWQGWSLVNVPQDMLEYRKKIKIYDAFIFFNELDLLEIRLNILDKYVDYFIIVESPYTFSGKEKELYFKNNKNRFEKFSNKIIHYVVESTPKNRADLESRLNNINISETERAIIQETLSNSNVPKGQDMWLREFYQRESIKTALEKAGIHDNDYCFISDVDEIWNPKIILDYRNDCVYKFRQIVYSYFLNNRSSESWSGTFATSYKNIKNKCLGDLRDKAKTVYTYISNGGWHFTHQGGPDRIRTKIDAYSHQEFNTDSVRSNIENNINNGKDFAGRNFHYWIDEASLPQYLKENKETHKEFFR